MCQRVGGAPNETSPEGAQAAIAPRLLGNPIEHFRRVGNPPEQDTIANFLHSTNLPNKNEYIAPLTPVFTIALMQCRHQLICSTIDDNGWALLTQVLLMPDY